MTPIMNDVPVEIDRAASAWLKATPLFQGLGEADFIPLVADCSTEMHGHHVPLYAKGESAEAFFLLMDGHVELYLDEDGRRSVLEVARPPALLGEAAMFLGVHAHSARSVGHCRLIRFPAQPFVAALNGRFDLSLRMLGSMSRRLRGLVAQVAELKLKTTAQRLAAFLLGLTKAEEGRASVRFPFDKRLAAESLGMTAESLSRALARLAELGVESGSENLVMIGDIGRLRAFLGEEDG